MTQTKFTVGSQWKTRSGHRAVVVANSALPVNGIWVWFESSPYGDKQTYLLTKNGRGDPDWADLIEPWVEKKKIEVEFQVWFDEDGQMWWPKDWPWGCGDARERFKVEPQPFAIKRYKEIITEGEGL